MVVMKKVIATPAGRWARELLTLAGAERIEYFLDDDEDIQKTGFPTGSSIKPVYPTTHIEAEDRDNIVIVITDSKRYAELRDRLDGFTTWTQYESSVGGFDYSEFSTRAGKMASMIPDDVTSIMDMGCGDEVLKPYLKPHIRYYGLDIVRRNADTIVCDANVDPLPDLQVDAYYMAGFLLYMNDVDKLISQMRRAKYLIFDLWNYVEFRKYDNIYMNIYTRRAQSVCWNEREHFLSLPEVMDALTANGFVIEKAAWLNRTGSYCCYRARNLHFGR